MAERRMFAKTIIDSDAFLAMPLSSQALYFHLSMRGDDEGFVNKPKSIQRLIGAGDDDLKLLIMKNFIIPFESGIVVIKHWKLHNYIRKDRITETVYQDEKSLLEEKDNGTYTLALNECLTGDGQVTDKCQHRLGKDRLVEDSIDKDKKNSSRFTPPTPEEIKSYCIERNNRVDPERFFDFYSSKGWMVGKNKMKDWKAAVRNWEKDSKGVQNVGYRKPGPGDGVRTTTPRVGEKSLNELAAEAGIE